MTRFRLVLVASAGVAMFVDRIPAQVGKPDHLRVRRPTSPA
jgi:hypothetical protein